MDYDDIKIKRLLDSQTYYWTLCLQSSLSYSHSGLLAVTQGSKYPFYIVLQLFETYRE